MFITAAYTCHMLAMQLRNTVGKKGYAPQNQNMYNIFSDNDTMATKTKTTNIAALTTGSTITGSHMAANKDLVIQAINQLSANQNELTNKMAAMSFNNANITPPQQYTAPPI